MVRYKGILFTSDGDWFTDLIGDSIDEVVAQAKDSGWWSHPFEGVILDKGRATSPRQRLLYLTSDLPADLKGKSISTVSKWLEEIYDS